MLTVQQKWFYLEIILVESGDNVEKVPKELDRFTEVNKVFKKNNEASIIRKKSQTYLCLPKYFIKADIY